MRKASGQTSVEMLLILAVSLAIIAVLVVYSYTQINEFNKQQAIQVGRSTINDIVNASNEVFNQGAGATRFLYVTIPEGVNAASSGISGQSIFLNVYSTDVIGRANITLSGSVPTTRGSYWLKVEAKEGYVNIGQTFLTTDKGSIYVALAQDSNASSTITLTNNSATESATVTIVKTWNNSNVSLTLSTSSFTLPANTSQPVVLDFNSNDSAIGNNVGSITITGVFTSSGTEQLVIPLNAEITSGINSNLVFLPDTWTKSIPTNSSDSNSFQLCNIGNSTITNIEFILSSGNPGDWINPISDISSLASKTCTTITVNVTVPSGTNVGNYTGQIIATDGVNIATNNLNFTVTGQATNFDFDWNIAAFQNSRSELVNWRIRNLSSTAPIQITHITPQLWSTCDSNQGHATAIELNSVSVWSGDSNDGTQIDITDTNIPVSTTYSSNKLKIDSDVNNEGEQFKLTFTFSDLTSYTSSTFGPGCTTDTTAPTAIPDLNARQGDNGGQIKLTWHATGDDANTGKANRYVLKWAKSIISTESAFNSAFNVLAEPTPGNPGDVAIWQNSNDDAVSCAYDDGNYTCDVDYNVSETYYWAVKAIDSSGNRSSLSNSPSSVPRGKFNMDSDTIIEDIPVAASTTQLLLDAWTVSSGIKEFKFEVQDDGNINNTWIFDINLNATGYNGYTIWYPVIGAPGGTSGPPYTQLSGGGGGPATAPSCYTTATGSATTSFNILTVLAPANCRYRNTTITKPNTLIVDSFTITDINLNIA